MSKSIFSDVVLLDKKTDNIEKVLSEIFEAEIIRWAIIDVNVDKIKVSCSYKK